MAVVTDSSIIGKKFERPLLINDLTTWRNDAPLRQSKLLIDGYEKNCLTPIGYDLRIGRRAMIMNKDVREEQIGIGGKIVLKPGDIAAIETEELIGMPKNKEYSGIIVSKVSMMELGLSAISTSIDPDYEDFLIIIVKNETTREIELERHRPFCTFIMLKNQHPADKDCRKSAAGHWDYLVKEWEALIKKPTRRRRILFAVKLIISGIPLAYLFVKFILIGVNEAEVSLMVAISTALFIVLDKSMSKI